MENGRIYKIRLLVLKLLGAATPEEEKQLETLAEEKENFRSLVDELSHPEEYQKRQEQLQLLDTEKELERFLSACHHKSAERKIRRFYRRAAAVVIPLLIGSVIAWQMLSIATSHVRQAPDTTIAPGSSGATLVLSNGFRQTLTADDCLLTESDGTEIRTDSNQLDYTAAKNSPRDTASLYNHLLVGRGFEYMLILQDGTKVWMNSESELHYPVQFTSADRKVRLQGEAYFEVAWDTTRPFLVEVNNDFVVKVLGTHFNIKAYPSDDQAETTLLEGKVSVSAFATNESVILAPAQQMIVRKNGENTVREVNPDNAIAWHNGWFYFDNEKLEKALEQIGRWYNTDFSFEDPECQDIRVSGKVKRFENLRVILDMLETATKCHFITDHGKIYITKNNRK